MRSSNSSSLATKKGVENSSFHYEDEPNLNSKRKKWLLKNNILIAITGIIIVILPITCFNSSSVDLNDLHYEKINSTWCNSLIFNKTVYSKNTMLPFSGRINNSYYKGKFIDGRKHGIHKEFYSGKLIKIGEYDNGIPIGNHKEWHSNQQLRFDVNYNNGFKEGLSKEYDDDGNLNRIDYNEGGILEYLNNYLQSPEYNFEKIFKSATQNRNTDYQFVFVKLDDDYFYGVIIENFTNSGDGSTQFKIGDIKFRVSVTKKGDYEYLVENSNLEFKGIWRMANRVKVKANMKLFYLDFITKADGNGVTKEFVDKFKITINFGSGPSYYESD